MEFAGLSLALLLKAFLRVVPLAIFLKLPASIRFPIWFKLLPVVALSIILALRFQNDGELASNEYFFDIALGIAVAVIVSLFFSASMQLTKFFREVRDEDESEDPWRDVLDSFTFIVLILLLMSLRLERSLLELLGSVNSVGLSHRFQSADLWTSLLREITWLALKISSFSFVLVLTKALFEEVYRRLGGENLRLVFSLSFWLILLAISPLFVPALGAFVSEQLSGFWRTWMGV